MSAFCTVIIVTHNQPKSLERTLTSLARCDRIAETEVIIVENSGNFIESEVVANAYAYPSTVKFIKTNDKSLAKARNLGSRAASGKFLIFFDDDIEVGTDTLASYIAAAQAHDHKHFFGGPLQAVYETMPKFWLRSHLPPSALGFSLGEELKEIREPLFLGGNFGIFKTALLNIKGFPEYLGITENYSALGEETVLQKRLLRQNYSGIYVPAAIIKHHVPATNCSLEFAKHRSYRLGITKILTEYVENGTRPPKFPPMWMYRNLIELKFLIILKKLLGRPKEQLVTEQIALMDQKGAFDAFKYLNNLDIVDQYYPDNHT
ncbi:glycosyltransferase family A protein [Kordiimonas aestuarii]|uniref:glycosyltransferase family A protein n=1 Tax=Kordiimonas aestuarii TaxID=1005925 RepID=UPI0021D195B8|nr:glycosyltransferase family A protein [Kordiimonas aestuarii]